ncbi:MAG: hypothetical protein M3525_01825 [Acidobacteriota bacterium]|nr:hypothetical protein [Acidobacteriota bacterium]
MRRTVFYLSVALLAFGIGSFVVFKFYFQTVEQPFVTEKIEIAENAPKIETKSEEIKYGCKEEELESFWENLDKAVFLKFKREEIKIRNTDAAFTSFPKSPDNLKRFDEEWIDFLKNFNCAYFAGVDNDVGLVDLNNDSEKEIFVIGELSNYHAEKELFVFQKKNGLWKTILFDIGNQETRVKATRTNGYLDIETKTSISGGYQQISVFKFNSNNYEEKVCYSDNKVVDIGDETIILNKAVITRNKCFQKFSNLLK